MAPLLEYADDATGGLMIPEEPVVRENITAANALDILRLLGPEAEDISIVLALEDFDKLVGTLIVIRLALARPNTLVGDLARREFVSVVPKND